jgi:hypothetical protein
MDLCSMQFSSASHHFIPFKPKYSPKESCITLLRKFCLLCTGVKSEHTECYVPSLMKSYNTENPGITRLQMMMEKLIF